MYASSLMNSRTTQDAEVEGEGGQHEGEGARKVREDAGGARLRFFVVARVARSARTPAAIERGRRRAPREDGAQPKRPRARQRQGVLDVHVARRDLSEGIVRIVGDDVRPRHVHAVVRRRRLEHLEARAGVVVVKPGEDVEAAGLAAARDLDLHLVHDLLSAPACRRRRRQDVLHHAARVGAARLCLDVDEDPVVGAERVLGPEVERERQHPAGHDLARDGRARAARRPRRRGSAFRRLRRRSR